MKYEMLPVAEQRMMLAKAIEAACSEVELVEGVSAAEVSFHFEYIVEKIHNSELFHNRDRLDPSRKKKMKNWVKIQDQVVNLDVSSRLTPDFAYDQMEECDPELRFLYLDTLDNIKKLSFLIRLYRRGSSQMGRPTNEDLEDAVGHLAAVYKSFFRGALDPKLDFPKAGPFFHFCQSIFVALDKVNLVGSLTAMIDKVSKEGYRPRYICLED